MNRKDTFMQSVRSVFGSKAYGDKQASMLKAVQTWYVAYISTEIPLELRLGDNNTPQHELTHEDFLPEYWDGKLIAGLFYTEAQDIIGEITAYMNSRNGTANDIWNLVCKELLIWVTRDISGIQGDEDADDALKKVQNRGLYLAKLISADIFSTDDDHGADNKSMLGVITSIRTCTLEQKIIPKLRREIAHSHVLTHLAKLKRQSKVLLDSLCQFIYYAARDSADPDAFDISRFSQNIATSTSGQLLKSLVESPSIATIFNTIAPSDTQAVEQSEGAKPALFFNPFIDEENQLIVPIQLLAGSKKNQSIEHFLKGKQSGIYPAFIEDIEFLNYFLELHALTIAYAQITNVCDDASQSARDGGDLLVYANSIVELNNTMSTVETVCNSITTCHNWLKDKAREQRGVETSKSGSSVSRAANHWLSNFENIASINGQIEDSLMQSIALATLIATNSTSISEAERFKIAQEETMEFIATSNKTCALIGNFINRQDVTQKKVAIDLPKAPEGGIIRARSPSMPAFFGGPPPSNRSPRELPSTERSTSVAKGRSATVTLSIIKAEQSSIAAQNSADNPDNLTVLEVPAQIMTDHTISFICNLLENRPLVKTVIFDGSSLSSTKSAPLWQALSKCKALRNLIVLNSPCLLTIPENGGIDRNKDNAESESVNAFSTFIQNSALKKLCINACGLNKRGAHLIAKGLSMNTTLKLIDIGSNPLEDEGTYVICEALTRNPSIFDFRIAFVRITDKGADHILTLLKNCTQLTDLMLDDKDISEDKKREIGLQLHQNRQNIREQATQAKAPKNLSTTQGYNY
jgi:hypothetical protein